MLYIGLLASPPAKAIEFLGFKFFEGEDSEPAVKVPDPLPYEAHLNASGADEDLKAALSETSRLVSDQASPPSGKPGLIARALGDQQLLIARLYQSGYYGGTVDITIAGRSLAQVTETGDFPGRAGSLVPVQVQVHSRPLFTFGATRVSIRPPVSDPNDALTPAALGLESGSPARSGNILTAEQRIVADLRAQGYPLARIANRSVVADHATRQLDVSISADAGPQGRFGHVSVIGTDRTDPNFVISQARIEQGTPYSPETLRRASNRLRDLGIFNTIRVREAERLDSNGELPIVIEVSERKLNVIGGGATISSVDGMGIEAYWRRRNLFGRGETLSLEGNIDRIGANAIEDQEYAARVVFTKPGVFGPLTNFTATLGAKRENPDPYEARSVYGKFRLSKQQTDAFEYGGGAEFAYSREEDAIGVSHSSLFGVFGDVAYDTRDDLLDPTKGIRATAFIEPAYDFETSTAMLFSKASLSAYRALDEVGRIVLAGRVSTGSILGASLLSIPPSRRYYVGGGGSVRGYAYRNIGPRVNGEVIGGRSFLEGSGEVRVKVNETFGVVGFVDAGAAYRDEFPDFSEDMKVGVGAGLRYYSPIGPLRLDVAVPLSPESGDPDFAIYVGLSQAF